MTDNLENNQKTKDFSIIYLYSKKYSFTQISQITEIKIQYNL